MTKLERTDLMVKYTILLMDVAKEYCDEVDIDMINAMAEELIELKLDEMED